LIKEISRTTLLRFIIYLSLGLSLVYSLFYLASSFGVSFFVFSSTIRSSILSGSWDIAVWGIAIFVVLARIGYDLEFNIVKGYYRSYAGVGLLVAICSMAVAVCAVILGFFSTIALVPISCLILSTSVIFSPDFFNVNRLPFLLRSLFCGLIIGLSVELAGFLV